MKNFIHMSSMRSVCFRRMRLWKISLMIIICYYSQPRLFSVYMWKLKVIHGSVKGKTNFSSCVHTWSFPPASRALRPEKSHKMHITMQNEIKWIKTHHYSWSRTRIKNREENSKEGRGRESAFKNDYLTPFSLADVFAI